ncbi:MAG: fibrobacter succinogenes major paralogous domain-containing protein [Bacteroidales bacterium]
MNFKNPFYTRLRYLNLCILVIIGLTFTSCDSNNDDPIPEGPASFEYVVADFITDNSANFTSDIAGDVSTITQMGFCWGESSAPSLEDNVIYFEEVIPGIISLRPEGLQADRSYYVRAFYSTEEHDFYSDEQVFQTTKPVDALDGNTYGTVKIGDQLWMTENLRTVTYNNGDSVTNGSGLGNYTNFNDPRFYFYYDDDTTQLPEYGKLYTWYVITDLRGVCPPDFRIPDIIDFENLILHLDPLATPFNNLSSGNNEFSAIAGGMLRATGNINDGTGSWEHPNGGANNVTQMSLLPSGYRDPSGSFNGLGFNAALWSFTEEDSSRGIMFYTHFLNAGFLTNNFSKKTGYSVRCMKEADL